MKRALNWGTNAVEIKVTLAYTQWCTLQVHCRWHMCLSKCDSFAFFFIESFCCWVFLLIHSLPFWAVKNFFYRVFEFNCDKFSPDWERHHFFGEKHKNVTKNTDQVESQCFNTTAQLLYADTFFEIILSYNGGMSIIRASFL